MVEDEIAKFVFDVVNGLLTTQTKDTYLLKKIKRKYCQIISFKIG